MSDISLTSSGSSDSESITRSSSTLSSPRANPETHELSPPRATKAFSVFRPCTFSKWAVFCGILLCLWVLYRLAHLEKRLPKAMVQPKEHMIERKSDRKASVPSLFKESTELGESLGGLTSIRGLPDIPRRIHWIHLRQLPKWGPTMMETWKELNPGFEFILYTRDMMESFIQTHHPRFSAAVAKLTKTANLDDRLYELMRYSLIYTFGGVYADIDTQPRVALDEWAKRASLPPNTTAIIGNSPDGKEFRDWFFACSPKHPVMEQSLELVYRNLYYGSGDVNANKLDEQLVAGKETVLRNGNGNFLPKLTMVGRNKTIVAWLPEALMASNVQNVLMDRTLLIKTQYILREHKEATRMQKILGLDLPG